MRSSTHIISEPLSQEAVFSFYDAVFTNGIHYVQMPNVQKGRMLLYSFLHPLSFYKKSGCFTLNPLALSPYVTNIYYFLSHNQYGDDYSLEDYFYDQCHFDFIWIEKDECYQKIFTHIPLVNTFEHMILSHQQDYQIPILIVHYA